QCGRRLQQIDFHLIPDPLGTTIVEAERSPQTSINQDGNRKHGVCAGFLEPSPSFRFRLREGDLDDLATRATLEPVAELRPLRHRDRIVLIAWLVRNRRKALGRPTEAATLCQSLTTGCGMHLEHEDAADISCGPKAA